MSSFNQNNNQHSVPVQGGFTKGFMDEKKEQVIVLVADDSGSMSGEKAKAANRAMKELLQEVSAGDNRDSFRAGAVTFSGSAKIVNKLQKATDLMNNLNPISPGGGTNIRAALEKAAELLAPVQAGHSNPLYSIRPVVFLFSDGRSNVGGCPRAAARKLKEKADLITIAFGKDADEKLLEELASSPQCFYRCSNGAELQMFLARAGMTIRHSQMAGMSASMAMIGARR
jgi:uncharacterized protein YegL